jgi:hypothetical protein
LAFKYGAHIGTGISALWLSTGKGKVHYGYWHSTMMPVPVLNFCNLVHYQYWHGSLLVLAFNGAHSGIGILALWFSTSMGTFHYRYWCLMLPVPVMAFLHFGSVPA